MQGDCPSHAMCGGVPCLLLHLGFYMGRHLRSRINFNLSVMLLGDLTVSEYCRPQAQEGHGG
jgi:hypothetical protein